MSLKPRNKNYYTDKQIQFLKAKYDTIALFYFDPNTATNNELTKLGLSKRQVNIISNYLSKGGKFSIREDFSRIYGISRAQFDILKPYIKLPDKKPKTSFDKENSNKSKKESTVEIELFEFDPNNTTSLEWQKLGLPDKLIKTINNYISKGGRFRNKTDLKKIYGLQEELYSTLEPFINIPEQNTITETQQTQNSTPDLQIELNSTNATELKELNGIGDYYSKGIIKYRDLLGGYVRKEQLLEVYGMKKSTYDLIKTQIVIDPSKIKKMNINFSSVKELIKHPYIEYYQAKAIINFQTKNGSYNNIEQLLTNKLLAENDFNKIKPYITTE
jgi:DNA uptake protein ComE-like DNA-binding protein